MPEYSIRDIAKLAGVSVGTVSRILNHAGNVDSEIRERTLRIMHEVNYRGGPRGRRPERNVSHTSQPFERILDIALISPGMSEAWKNNELWSSYMQGIETACRERHCRLTLCMAECSGREIAELASKADGVLIKMDAQLPDYVKELMTRIPAVGFGAVHTADPLPQAVIDNNSGGMVAAEELLKLGHRRIAFVNHQCRSAMFIARSNGYLETMKREGLFRPAHLIELEGAPLSERSNPEQNPPDMNAALEFLLNQPEPPTAVIVANDWGAYGFLQACRSRGVRVPLDLSLAGMDDSGQLCTLLHPSLSSVKMPFNRVSHFAASMLCDLIQGVGIHQRNRSAVVRIPGRWVHRDSVTDINR